MCVICAVGVIKQEEEECSRKVVEKEMKVLKEENDTSAKTPGEKEDVIRKENWIKKEDSRLMLAHLCAGFIQLHERKFRFPDNSKRFSWCKLLVKFMDLKFILSQNHVDIQDIMNMIILVYLFAINLENNLFPTGHCKH